MRSKLCSLLVAVALLSGAVPALADVQPVGNHVYAQDEGRGRGRWRERQGGENGQDRVIPLDAIISGLMSSYPGKPLDARGPMQRGENLIYEIVWLTENGRQIVIIVDARTGQVRRVLGLS